MNYLHVNLLLHIAREMLFPRHTTWFVLCCVYFCFLCISAPPSFFFSPTLFTTNELLHQPQQQQEPFLLEIFFTLLFVLDFLASKHPFSLIHTSCFIQCVLWWITMHSKAGIFQMFQQTLVFFSLFALAVEYVTHHLSSMSFFIADS